MPRASDASPPRTRAPERDGPGRRLRHLQKPKKPKKLKIKEASESRAEARTQVVFTIVSANYIGFAATLMRSVATHMPEVKRFIIMSDVFHDFGDLELSADLLWCDQIEIPNIDNMKLWYSVMEFNTALKPYAFLHFFHRHACDEACYIDPDILLFSEMTEVFTALQDHSCVLIPHMTDPLQDGKEPSDLTIMKSGVYNLGFLGLRNDKDGLRLAEWWADRCFTHCRVDIPGNLFTDQRWMDLAPAFVTNPMILRHPGYNVAYWNLAHRIVEKTKGGEWIVNGQRLVFFHFSGIDPTDPKQFSKHQNRFGLHNLGVVNDLCNLYRDRVLKNGWQKYSKLPYGFGNFPDGHRIDEFMRHWIVRMIDDGRLDSREPLNLSSDFFDRPDERAAEKGATLTRYMYQVWMDRHDLHVAFDIYTPGGLRGYFDWFIGGSAASQGIDNRCVAAAEKLLTGGVVTSSTISPLQIPPWPRVCSEIWGSNSEEAFVRLAEDATFKISGAIFFLPKQVALLWERRRDLQLAFDVATPEGFQDYLCWAMTIGIVEGAVVVSNLSAEFISAFRQTSGISDHYGDVPVTEGMIVVRHVAAARDRVPGWQRFPVERSGRLAHGLWFAHIAPKQFGWPASFVAPVRDYFWAPTAIIVDGFALSRGSLALWELRPDLQRTFPLSNRVSSWRFLRWLLTDGLGELGLTIDEFDPRLRAFLLRDSPRFEGISELLEMLYDYRPDLQENFTLVTVEGRMQLGIWAKLHLLEATEAMSLGEALVPATVDSDTPIVTQNHRTTVALSGFWSAPSGRGEDLRGSAEALTAVGYSAYVVVDFEAEAVILPDGIRLPTGTEVEVEVNVVHTNPDTSVEDAQLLKRLGIKAEKTIGFWAWELEWLPDYWRHAYSFYDEIWAATKFAAAAFTRDSPRPVRLVPMAVVNPRIDIELSRSDLGLPPQATVFLFMFDFRSWAIRKNPEAVIKAFAAAFPAGDESTYLLIKTSGAAARPADWNRLKDLANDPRIELRDVLLSRSELLNVVRLADAFVSLHRSEGFGRGPAEAMLAGVPTIITNYSGPADYATTDCALVVDYELIPVQETDYPGVCGQRWADASVPAAARHMRWIHENPARARILGMRGRDQIRRLYNSHTIGEGMLRTLGVALDRSLTGIRSEIRLEIGS